MNEQEITELIKKVVKEIKNEEILSTNKKNILLKEEEDKIIREITLNSYFNIGTEVYKTIIVISLGAIGLFAVNKDFIQNIKDNKVLLILGLTFFLLSFLTAIFAFLLIKKDLENKWSYKQSYFLEILIKFFSAFCVWTCILGVLLISIITFIQILNY